MQKSNLPTKIVIALTLVAITLVSSSVFANVYKWRDSSGRAQYSDTPPPTSYSIVKGSELVNALQSKDVCTVPGAKPNLITQSKWRKLSANFDFIVGGSPNPGPSMYTINRVTTIGSIAKTSATIASITKYVASNAIPTIISPVAASPLVKLVSKPALSSTPTPVATSAAIATNPAPNNVAINLPPNIVKVALMPAVDISKNMTPAIGSTIVKIEPTSDFGALGGEGAFRMPCKVSHMSNDDPIVYPNQKGAAHHHTFFGNTSLNYVSDLNNLRLTGNSTCSGGIANRSAYWMPSMIDTATNTPIVPSDAIFYYKTGYGGVPTNLISPVPKGLRMITGNSKGNSATTGKGMFACRFAAGGSTDWTNNIQNCNVGDMLLFTIVFPQCWDGKNLDSPDHKSHMADPDGATSNHCPITHPIAIPSISFNAHFLITKADEGLHLRLSSDNYATSSPGGYSAHADYVNGWDENIMAGWIKNCINASKDCHGHLLGDGRALYE